MKNTARRFIAAVCILLVVVLVYTLVKQRKSYASAPTVDPINVRCTYAKAPVSPGVFAGSVLSLPSDGWGKGNTLLPTYNSTGPPAFGLSRTILLGNIGQYNWPTVKATPPLTAYGWSGPGCYIQYPAFNANTGYAKQPSPWAQYFRDNTAITPGSMTCPSGYIADYSSGKCILAPPVARRSR
jgi:hypothetical protein